MAFIHRLCFALCMSLVLSFLMSGWVTFINIGATQAFVSAWLHAFILAWPPAFVISLTMGKAIGIIARRLAEKVGKATGVTAKTEGRG